jgi:TldD protein
MKRRDFLRVTAKGSIFAAASPAIIEFLLRQESSAQGIAFASGDLEAMLGRVIARALANGGQFADVYLEEVVRTGINLSDGKITSVDYGIDKGGGVRVVSDWKTGYAYCDSWGEDQLNKVAGVAAEISRGGSPLIVALAASKPHPVISYRTAPDEVGASRKAEAVMLADRIARAYDPAIKQVRVGYRDEMKRVVVATSDGVFVKQEMPLVWIDINTLAERNGKRHPGYVRQSKRMGFEYVDDALIEGSAREAARQAVAMLDAIDAPSGEMPVVIGKGGGVVFHEAVGHGLEGDAVERKTSFFAGLVGTKVATESVTIIDDGSIPDYRGSYDCDDEGTPSGKSVLIESGELKGYMLDLMTARKMGKTSTGNGRRQSYMYYPIVRMSNTYIAEGTAAPDDVIASTDRGLYARSFGGGEVDTATGNFTFAVREAYLIEKGKLTTPVRGATLIGSGPEILKRIDLVADDLEFWPGTCGKADQWVPITSGSPTLRISSIAVGGTI